MIKVVLDTNIFVSALLFDGKPEQIVFLASERKIIIILSLAVIDELQNVLIEKFHRNESEVRKLIRLIVSISQLAKPKAQVKILKYVPDNKILEAALAGKVDFIVTGDKKHLLPLKNFRQISIVTPQEFMEKFDGRSICV